MTEPQLEPLWSDERINDLIIEILATSTHTPRGLTRRVSYAVRDEYETRIAQLEAQLVASYKREGEVEIAWAYVLAELVEAQQRIAELEEAASPALGWIDEIYPPSVFDGSSGDSGAVEIVAIREALRQALEQEPRP
jgi:hypothetical protein